jgi:hypothetical protein
MDIKFDDLAHGPNNFKDGVEFFDDIKEWAEAYEKSYMVPVSWQLRTTRPHAFSLITHLRCRIRTTTNSPKKLPKSF